MEIDPRLVTAASQSRNFGLLVQVEPLLAIYGAGAESTAYSDPNGAIIKCRQFGEVAAEQLVIRSSTRFDGSRQVDRIAALERNGILTAAVADAFHDIRKIGNNATHEHLFDVRAALTSLKRCWQIGNLLRLALLKDQTPRSFIAPEPPTSAQFGDEGSGRDIADLLDRSRTELTDTLTKLDSTRSAAEAEAQGRRAAEAELEQARRQQAAMAETVAALQAQVDGLVESGKLDSAAIPAPDKAQAADFTHKFRRRPPLNEVQSRRNIDRQLTESGWTVQDYADIDPTAALGVAVREFPLASGFADYVLYVDNRIVGVIEAKREGTALIAVEHQTRKYAEGLRAEHQLAAWRRGEPLPFRYESTGAETRFTNQLDPKPRSREVFQFARPESVQTWMHQAEADPESPTLRARILALPELQPDGLRPNQFDAIKGIEKSLKETRPRGLVRWLPAQARLSPQSPQATGYSNTLVHPACCSSSTATISASKPRANS